MTKPANTGAVPNYDLMVLDPPALDALVDHLERQNTFYIKGTRYVIDELLAGPTSEGTYYARLRPAHIVNGWEIPDLKDSKVDLSDAPF